MRCTRHLSLGDVTPYFNETQKRRGKCTILSRNNSDAEPINGLVRNTAGITIQVNSYCEMVQGDIVTIMGEEFRVHDYSINTDKGQTRRRKDYSNFTGTTIVFLEG